MYPGSPSVQFRLPWLAGPIFQNRLQCPLLAWQLLFLDWTCPSPWAHSEGGRVYTINFKILGLGIKLSLETQDLGQAPVPEIPSLATTWDHESPGLLPYPKPCFPNLAITPSRLWCQLLGSARLPFLAPQPAALGQEPDLGPFWVAMGLPPPGKWPRCHRPSQLPP